MIVLALLAGVGSREEAGLDQILQPSLGRRQCGVDSELKMK